MHIYLRIIYFLSGIMFGTRVATRRPDSHRFGNALLAARGFAFWGILSTSFIGGLSVYGILAVSSLPPQQAEWVEAWQKWAVRGGIISHIFLLMFYYGAMREVMRQKIGEADAKDQKMYESFLHPRVSPMGGSGGQGQDMTQAPAQHDTTKPGGLQLRVRPAGQQVADKSRTRMGYDRQGKPTYSERLSTQPATNHDPLQVEDHGPLPYSTDAIRAMHTASEKGTDPGVHVMRHAMQYLRGHVVSRNERESVEAFRGRLARLVGLPATANPYLGGSASRFGDWAQAYHATPGEQPETPSAAYLRQLERDAQYVADVEAISNLPDEEQAPARIAMMTRTTAVVLPRMTSEQWVEVADYLTPAEQLHVARMAKQHLDPGPTTINVVDIQGTLPPDEVARLVESMKAARAAGAPIAVVNGDDESAGATVQAAAQDEDQHDDKCPTPYSFQCARVFEQAEKDGVDPGIYVMRHALTHKHGIRTKRLDDETRSHFRGRLAGMLRLPASANPFSEGDDSSSRYWLNGREVGMQHPLRTAVLINTRDSSKPIEQAINLGEQTEGQKLMENQHKTVLPGGGITPVQKCEQSPPGWVCSRAPGHEGPCAASPTEGARIMHSGVVPMVTNGSNFNELPRFVEGEWQEPNAHYQGRLAAYAGSPAAYLGNPYNAFTDARRKAQFDDGFAHQTEEREFVMKAGRAPIHSLPVGKATLESIQKYPATFTSYRHDGRDFEKGDYLVLREVDPATGACTGRREFRMIADLSNDEHLLYTLTLVPVPWATQQNKPASEGTQAAWLPTAEAINALPEGPRAYIHALVAQTDPAGMVAENTLLRDQTRQLDAMIGRLKAERTEAREVYLVATGETHNGAETYTRHADTPPPLCDAELLYTVPTPSLDQHHVSLFIEAIHVMLTSLGQTPPLPKDMTGPMALDLLRKASFHVRAARKEQPADGEAYAGYRAMTAITVHELRALLKNPTVLAELVSYHDVQETEATAMDPEAGEVSRAAAKRWLDAGRAIIAEDPEIHDEDLRRKFMARHSEGVGEAGAAAAQAINDAINCKPAEKAHSIDCLYGYALARLQLKDSRALRILFWDAHDKLEWDDARDGPKTPEFALNVCARCHYAEPPEYQMLPPGDDGRLVSINSGAVLRFNQAIATVCRHVRGSEAEPTSVEDAATAIDQIVQVFQGVIDMVGVQGSGAYTPDLVYGMPADELAAMVAALRKEQLTAPADFIEHVASLTPRHTCVGTGKADQIHEKFLEALGVLRMNGYTFDSAALIRAFNDGFAVAHGVYPLAVSQKDEAAQQAEETGADSTRV